jgi:hypothetical protein
MLIEAAASVDCYSLSEDQTGKTAESLRPSEIDSLLTSQ